MSNSAIARGVGSSPADATGVLNAYPKDIGIDELRAGGHMEHSKQPVVKLDRDWLTLKQAMAYMQCGPGTLMKYIKAFKAGKPGIDGQQPSGKNGSWRVSSASIDKFMKSGGRP
jgi:hypothetical protein